MKSSAAFWLAERPLVLASGSAARRALLEITGVPLEIAAAPVDETAIAAALLDRHASPHEIASALALAKAEAATLLMPDRTILTADQTLDHNGRLLMKPTGRAQARDQLRQLCNSTHSLHSAAVLRSGDRVLWYGSASAKLTMRNFSDEFLETYLDEMDSAVFSTVGGYQLEALGPHLFSRIEGDHATILGLPLLEVLSALRDHGMLAR